MKVYVIQKKKEKKKMKVYGSLLYKKIK
jgi:hypothetical protein